MTRTPQQRLVGYLAAQHRAIQDGEADLRQDQSTVHGVRVAARRIRSTLRTFAPLFDAGRADRFDAELSWFAALLGEVRDRQVQRRRFADKLQALPAEWVLGPVAADIEQRLLAEQLEHTRNLLAALASDRYSALVTACAHWAEQPPLRQSVRRNDLRKLTGRSRKKTGKRLAQGLAGDDAALHRARKSAKRTRYAAELAGPAVPGRTVTRFEKLQTLLGEHQDSVVAADLLRRWGAATADNPGANGFTYGLLFAAELQHGKRSRKQAARWKP